MTDRPTTKMIRRLGCIAVIVVLVVVYIGVQVFTTAVAESDKWQELANSQQLKSTVVQASRGTIFDSTGQVLAKSATVYTVYCDQKMLWDDFISQKDVIIADYKETLAKTKDKDKIAAIALKLAVRI